MTDSGSLRERQREPSYSLRAAPKGFATAVYFFIVTGVLCLASGVLTAIFVAIRPGGFRTSVFTGALIDVFAVRHALGAVTLDLGFAFVFGVAFVLGAIFLRRRKRWSPPLLLGIAIALPTFNVILGLNQGGTQMAFAIVAVIVMFLPASREFLNASRRADEVNDSSTH
jgi:choline-glycine betaine transporter